MLRKEIRSTSKCSIRVRLSGEMLRILRDAIQMAEKNGHHLWAAHFGLEMAWMYEQACEFEGA
jgi:hypothetical protein